MTGEEAANRFSEAQAICRDVDTSTSVDESSVLELSHSLLPQNSVSPFRSLREYLSEIQQESAAHYKQQSLLVSWLYLNNFVGKVSS